ncbi:Transmembrane Protease Serine 7, partial [Manis pentadactyla]
DPEPTAKPPHAPRPFARTVQLPEAAARTDGPSDPAAGDCTFQKTLPSSAPPSEPHSLALPERRPDNKLDFVRPQVYL